MTNEQLEILKTHLARTLAPHLPPLLDLGKPADQIAGKNISRAFSGFCLQKLLNVDAITAATAVVDDFDDNGIDLIYHHQPSKRLFLIQSKLKVTEPFSQEEALAFTTGVRDLVNERFERFNMNVQGRREELDAALDDANEIILVVAHAAEKVSQHAKDALDHFLADAANIEERLSKEWLDFGPERVVKELLAEEAVRPVDDELVIHGPCKIETPRVTYYGQVSVRALADLYEKHGNGLLEKNIRFFLGIRDSTVNQEIRETLYVEPEEFFYLSNGVTAIAHTIEQKGWKDGGRRFEVKGLSIINGAQTIASSHHFIKTFPETDVTAARVLLTLIQVNQDDIFSTEVTRARNHQNPVSIAHFAALDGIQERLRRELAFHKIIYRYRPEAYGARPGLDVMTIDDAAIALALFHPDPSFPVTLKREPSKFLNTVSAEYGKLFNSSLSGVKLANAVRIYRIALGVLGISELVSAGEERLVYRHGRYAILWLTLCTNAEWITRKGVMTGEEAAALLSRPLDVWREKVCRNADLARSERGPLAFFRNLADTRPLVVRLREEGI